MAFKMAVSDILRLSLEFSVFSLICSVFLSVKTQKKHQNALILMLDIRL